MKKNHNNTVARLLTGCISIVGAGLLTMSLLTGCTSTQPAGQDTETPIPTQVAPTKEPETTTAPTVVPTQKPDSESTQPTQTPTHAPKKRLTSVTHIDNEWGYTESTTYTYDGEGRIKSETYKAADIEEEYTYKYGLNHEGIITHTIINSIDGIEYSYLTVGEYDQAWRLIKTTDKTDEAHVKTAYPLETEYSYSESGNLIGRSSYPLGSKSEATVTTYSYDANGNQTKESIKFPDGTEHIVYEYEYDDHGNIIAQKDTSEIAGRRHIPMMERG